MKKLGILILMLAFVGESFAWGPTGHRTVGWIADKHLNAKAKKKLKTLLGAHSLAYISTWMDEVRSDSTHEDMSDWHWVTIETGKSYQDSPKNPKGDAIMTIERMISELKSHKLSKEKEIEAIKILAHLVGDIHMPLHVGCCDDQGGNKVRVKWFRSETNLHHVWDSDMIEDTKLSYKELAEFIDEPDAATTVKWQKQNVLDWVRESMSYRKQVYAIGDGNLGYKYIYKNMDTVKLRLIQAGIRLAGVLNEVYGK
jgi:hypothetical protein